MAVYKLSTTRVNARFRSGTAPIVAVVHASEGGDEPSADRSGGRPSETGRAGDARLEVFVEPFEEAKPGPHVAAAVEALETAGIEVDLGALATTADGSVDELVAAAAELLRATFEHGATAVQLRIERT